MKLSGFPIIIFVFLYGARISSGFRVSPDGTPKLYKKAVEDAGRLLLLTKVDQPCPLKPCPLGEQLPATGTTSTPDESSSDDVDEAPPILNHVLGTEKPCLVDYWNRPDIHTFGNVGLGGAIHAAMAPLATKMIDVNAYGGKDVRKLIADELRARVKKSDARVLDLCCGVGMSTRALESAFHDAEAVLGVDTSPEMISMAQAIARHDFGYDRASRLLRLKLKLKSGLFKNTTKLVMRMVKIIRSANKFRALYRHGNAEKTNLPKFSFDLVTIMFGFHEVPMEGRSRIINEARRCLRPGGSLAVVDICPGYQPSGPMLAGEPFVLEYQRNIDEQLDNSPGFALTQRKYVVAGHVKMWVLTADGR